MEEVFIDSTRMDADAAWPTEAKTISALMARIRTNIFNLRGLDLCINLPKEVNLLLTQIEKSCKAVALGMGAKGAEKKRKSEYRKIIKSEKKLTAHFLKASTRIRLKIDGSDILPSLQLRQENILEQIETDIHNARLCSENARKRVIQNGKVAPAQKVLGVSDPDAEIISKGRKPLVFGYKPQVARSLNGFILAVEVPQGAASDSSMAVNTVEASTKATKVVPKIVSFDDGYASNENREKLSDMGIELISFSGSKGKKITPKEEWDSKLNLQARNKRSMVESTMAVLKRDFGKDRLSRRGIEAVTHELKAVALFHNLRLCHRLANKKLKKEA